MKLLSWNVNGIRSPSMNLLTKNKEMNKLSHFYCLLKKYNPDIITLNETKCSLCHTNIFNELEELKDYHKIWNCATSKKGYSGTAIFTKIKPINSTYNIPNLDEINSEGRSITVEYDTFFLLNTYVPNSGRSEERKLYRQTIWDKHIFNYVKFLEKTKPVVWVGDFNVAHNSIDIHSEPKKPTPGYLPGERNNFSMFLQNGFIDCFREMFPDRVQYTWWDYKSKARLHNRGWRIDYTLVSNYFFNKVKNIQILDNTLGSDHCPILTTLDLTLKAS